MSIKSQHFTFSEFLLQQKQNALCFLLCSVIHSEFWDGYINVSNRCSHPSYERHKKYQNKQVAKIVGCKPKAPALKTCVVPPDSFFQTVFIDPTSAPFETYWPLYSRSVGLNNHCHTCRCLPSTAIGCNNASSNGFSQGHIVINTNLPVSAVNYVVLSLVIQRFHSIFASDNDEKTRK